MILQINPLSESTFNYYDEFMKLVMSYAPKVVGAIVLYFIGSFIVSAISKAVTKILSAKNFDISLQKFLGSFVKILLNILLLLTVFGVLGVNLTSFAAILAGLAVGVGAALNGTLGNFAGGVMMLLFRPFKVGDLIEAQGHLGTVTELGVFNTFLLTPENKTVILANGAVSTGTIVNFTTHGNLRVDLSFAITPDADIDHARKVAMDVMANHPLVLKTPAPEVHVEHVGDGLVKLAVRPYCTQQTYWDVYFGIREDVKKAFDKAGFQQPIPHRVIIQK